MLLDNEQVLGRTEVYLITKWIDDVWATKGYTVYLMIDGNEKDIVPLKTYKNKAKAMKLFKELIKE